MPQDSPQKPPVLTPDQPYYDASGMAGRGDDAGRLIPEARQLLHDLDARVLEAAPVIANLAAITATLRNVCDRLESLFAKQQAGN
jgi:ABC-type transporter Mla subunit MlaD